MIAERGNRVIGKVPENVNIHFMGCNAELSVGENAVIGQGCSIRLGADACISIGNNVNIGKWGVLCAFLIIIVTLLLTAVKAQ